MVCVICLVIQLLLLGGSTGLALRLIRLKRKKERRRNNEKISEAK